MIKRTMPSGGKRKGAGRPKGDIPTKVVSFRVETDPYEKAKEIHGRSLNQKVNGFIKRLSKKKMMNIL